MCGFIPAAPMLVSSCVCGFAPAALTPVSSRVWGFTSVARGMWFRRRGNHEATDSAGASGRLVQPQPAQPRRAKPLYLAKRENQQCGSDLHKSHWSFLIQVNPTNNIYDIPFHSFLSTLGGREEGSQS